MENLTSQQEDFLLESWREEAHKDDILIQKLKSGGYTNDNR